MSRSNWSFTRILSLTVSAAVLALVAVAFLFARPKPSAPAPSAPRAAVSSHQTIDLGAGYRMTLNGDNSQIVAPESGFKFPAQVPYLYKIDIGSGFWLVITPEGGMIVPQGSR